MRYIYANLWNDDRFFPVEELTEAQARVRYDTGSRQFDVAAVPDEYRCADPDDVNSRGDTNLFTLTVAPQGYHVRCTRYNPVGSVREVLHYKLVDGQMFLWDLTWYAYPDLVRPYGELYALATGSYMFRPDGTGRETVTVSEEAATGSGDPEDLFAVEGRHVTNFTDGRTDWLWEPALTFGDWERFGRPRIGVDPDITKMSFPDRWPHQPQAPAHQPPWRC